MVLRTNLQFCRCSASVHRLVVTSPMPSEGKSFICANLAVAFAQAGKRVVLIDGDLHRPRQHRLFGLINSIGITSASLAAQEDDEVNPAHYLQETAIPNLRILTSWPSPPKCR